LEEAERKEKERAAKQAEKDQTTFKQVFDRYLPAIKAERKNPKSWKMEESLNRLWISPVIGSKPLSEIAPIHLEKIKSTMAKADKAPRTIHYALTTIRQVFNFAKRQRIFNGENPVSEIKLPKLDNRRLRFLSQAEADKLLAALSEKSQDVHDAALLSLHCGARADEIFSLTWQDVDLDRGILTFRDAKAGTRPAFLTNEAKRMIEARPKGEPTAFVFPARGGKKTTKISHSFWRVVDDLKFNEGIKDRRLKVTFHSLRHSYASWLVENGTDLYAVKELLGHKDFKMTSRYSHLSPSALQETVKQFEKSLQKKVMPLNLKQSDEVTA
jgi:site-specific recombinase XerD